MKLAEWEKIICSLSLDQLVKVTDALCVLESLSALLDARRSLLELTEEEKTQSTKTVSEEVSYE